jgi:glutamine phosphoribosylpyrophosphate amidotransferase
MDESEQILSNQSTCDEVLRKVGRNVLLFQQIEALLKFLVANHRRDGNTSNFEEQLQQRTQKTYKQSKRLANAR